MHIVTDTCISCYKIIIVLLGLCDRDWKELGSQRYEKKFHIQQSEHDNKNDYYESSSVIGVRNTDSSKGHRNKDRIIRNRLCLRVELSWTERKLNEGALSNERTTDCHKKPQTFVFRS